MRFKRSMSFVLIAWLVLYSPSFFSFATGPTTPNNNEAIENANLPDFITQVTAEQLKAYYTFRHNNKYDAFNGCVLIAKDGKTIYQGAFGYGNFTTKDTLTTQSSFQLASTSKTFTSAAILKLVEEGQMSLDDTIQKFYPEFPYHNITVKLLLSHRSGLPEYIYWGQEYIGKNTAYLTNQTMVDVLIKKHPPMLARPDKMFHYCNTNFALLASIVEKVSNMSFKQYMHDNIFAPLGMTSTYVFDMAEVAPRCNSTSCYLNKWSEWNVNFSDGVAGDKGIYSSVEDMLKWDVALKQGKVISYDMQQLAYTPQSLDRYSFRDRSRNYGYGWRLMMQPDRSYVVYHNGNWHGCNNVFTRDITNGYTIIVLSNKANERNYQTQAVWDMLGQMKNAHNVAGVSDPGTSSTTIAPENEAQ